MAIAVGHILIENDNKLYFYRILGQALTLTHGKIPLSARHLKTALLS